MQAHSILLVNSYSLQIDHILSKKIAGEKSLAHESHHHYQWTMIPSSIGFCALNAKTNSEADAGQNAADRIPIFFAASSAHPIYIPVCHYTSDIIRSSMSISNFLGMICWSLL